MGGIYITRNLSFGTAVSVPADFPVYPHARRGTSFRVAARDGDPAHAVSVVTWVSRDGADAVRQFYAASLDRGDWEVIDQNNSRIVFRRKSTGNFALLSIRGELLQTVIQLQMTGAQPLDPGAPHAIPPPSTPITS